MLRRISYDGMIFVGVPSDSMGMDEQVMMARGPRLGRRDFTWGFHALSYCINLAAIPGYCYLQHLPQLAHH